MLGGRASTPIGVTVADLYQKVEQPQEASRLLGLILLAQASGKGE